MKMFFLILAVTGCALRTAAQTREQKLMNTYLELINELRKNPGAFATKYAVQLEDFTEFNTLLKKKSPLPVLSLDKKLSSSISRLMGGSYSESDFDGICGISGSEAHMEPDNFDDRKEMLELFIEMLEGDRTNLLDPSVIKLGMDAKITGEKANMRFIYGTSCDLKDLRQNYVSSEKADTSGIDFNRLNTAKNAAYLTPSEKQMILEINFVRCHPATYATILSAELSKRSAENGGLEPDEFVALEEIIERLKKMKALAPIHPAECITRAAQKHGADMKAHGFVAHDGTGGSGPGERMKKACGDILSSGENIGGGDESIRIKVIKLLLDDGISGRGHREILLDPQWTHVGVHYVQKVGLIDDIWVQDFARF